MRLVKDKDFDVYGYGWNLEVEDRRDAFKYLKVGDIVFSVEKGFCIVGTPYRNDKVTCWEVEKWTQSLFNDEAEDPSTKICTPVVPIKEMSILGKFSYMDSDIIPYWEFYHLPVQPVDEESLNLLQMLHPEVEEDELQNLRMLLETKHRVSRYKRALKYGIEKIKKILHIGLTPTKTKGKVTTIH